MGLHDFYRVPVVGTNEIFIGGLADMIMARIGDTGIKSDVGAPLCPSGYKECCMRQAHKLEF